MRVQPWRAVIVSMSLTGCVLPGSGGQSISVGGSDSGGGTNPWTSMGGGQSNGGSSQSVSAGGNATVGGGSQSIAAGGITSSGGSLSIAAGGTESGGVSSVSSGGSQPTSSGGSAPVTGVGGVSSGGSSDLVSSGGINPSSGGSAPTTGAAGSISSGGTNAAGGTLSNGGTSESLSQGGNSPGGTGGTSLQSATGGMATGGTSAGTGGRPSCPPGADVCDDSGKCMVLDSPQHCGSCSNDCETAETSASTNWRCNTGVCLIDTCKTGYGNCDGTTSNGCEKDLTSDPQHCGACTDRVCDYPSCVAGECSIISIHGNPVVPSDLVSATVIGLHPGSVLGVPQTLNPNDSVVSFGAVVRAGALFRAKFQMALYDSDDAGMPSSLLVSSDSLEYSDDSYMIAADGVVEKKLKRPYVVFTSTPRTFWIMLWVVSTDDLNLVTTNQRSPQEVRVIEAQSTWPGGPDWTLSFEQVPPPADAFGFFPHVFVTYVPGPVI